MCTFINGMGGQKTIPVPMVVGHEFVGELAVAAFAEVKRELIFNKI
jgi:D-arabinose 1-dehydrogenase-like Zn-dependent alcohol dehydrogenase